MLIVMAGLPGTGKSTLAARLAAALPGVVLSKDSVRAALFPPPAGDFSAVQDEIAMSAVYAAAGHLLRADSARAVILDGRTFSRRGQLDPVFALAAGLGISPTVIECVCSDDAAEARLTRDHTAGVHPAGNRTPALYRERKAAADPLTVPRLVIDTTARTPDDCLRLALAAVRPGA